MVKVREGNHFLDQEKGDVSINDVFSSTANIHQLERKKKSNEYESMINLHGT